MKIISIIKASTNILVIQIDEGDDERAFVIAAPPEIRDQFANALAALIVLQRLEDVE